MLFSSVAWAQSSGAAQQPSMFEMLIPFVVIFAVFYFLMIRPQSKRQKKHLEFITQLKRGDSVLTSSGILGTIEGLTEKFVTLEVSDGVRIKLLRSEIRSAATDEV